MRANDRTGLYIRRFSETQLLTIQFEIMMYRRVAQIVLVAALACGGVTAPVTAQSPITMPRASAGVIRPGDVLRLRIWREPDWSGDYPVSALGEVTLPRLGTMSVSGTPADSLRNQLTDKYRYYLNNPSIEMEVLRRVSVSGAVRTPGVYPLDPTMTISDAIALAGGPSPDGARDKVEIRRGGERIFADLRTDELVADSPVQSGDQLYVPARNWLSRNTWLLSTIIGSALTITAFVVRR